MEIRQIWVEIRLLFRVPELDASMKEAFEAISAQVEKVIAQAVGDDVSASLVKPTAGLERNLDSRSSGMTPLQRDLTREFRRYESLTRRWEALWTAIREELPRGPSQVLVKRCEDFTIRFERFRRRRVMEKHLPPDEARRWAEVQQAEVDPREIAALLRKVSRQSGGREGAEELLAGVLRLYPPCIVLRGTMVSIICPHWHCDLTFTDDETAGTASSALKRQYAKDLPASRSLRRRPNLRHLLGFLAKALPARAIPSSVSFEQS